MKGRIMCIITNGGAWIRDAYDARKFLESQGLNKFDIEEFGELIQPANFEDLECDYEKLCEEFRSYEASLDAAQGVLNELLNMCAEKMQSERTKAAREAYRAIYDLVYNSDAV